MRFLNVVLGGAALILSFISHGVVAQVVADCTDEPEGTCCQPAADPETVGSCTDDGMCNVDDMCEFCAGWALANTCDATTPVYLGDDVDCGIFCDESDDDDDCGICTQGHCCMSAGTSAVELCGGWDGACANPTPVYLGDNVGCFLNCDASDCCRSEICQDWNGVCADPTPEYLGDGEDCFGTCSTAKCCRSQICEDWNGVCVDPTPVYLGNNQDCAGTCNADKCCESGPLDITCSLTILGGVCGEEATIDIAAPVAAATPAGLAITPDPNVPLSNTDVAPWEEFHTYTVTDANGNTDTCRVEMSVVGNCEDPEQVCDPVKKVCEELCGTWNGACEDPTPVYLGDGVGCGGTCDESTCCRSDEPTPAPTPPPAPTPGEIDGAQPFWLTAPTLVVRPKFIS